MSYELSEKSAYSSEPFELYFFEGTYSNYYYTSDSMPHDFDGFTYEPLPGLSRSDFSVVSHTDDAVTLTIKLPIGAKMAKDYAFQNMPPELEMTIYRVQRSGGFAPYFSGKIQSISIDNEFAIFKIPSKFTAILSSAIPINSLQPSCNNVLYDSMCKVNRAANTISTIVSAINGRFVTVNATITNLVNGEAVAIGYNDRRMIIGQVGNVIEMNYEFSTITVGTPIELTRGCDHALAGGCTFFGNVINFGGMPYLPGESKNVFSVGVK